MRRIAPWELKGLRKCAGMRRDVGLLQTGFLVGRRRQTHFKVALQVLRTLAKLCVCLIVGLVVSSSASFASVCPPTIGVAAVPRSTPMAFRLAEVARALPSGSRTLVLGDSVAGRWPRSELAGVLGDSSAIFLALGGDDMENTIALADEVNPEAARSLRTVLESAGSANLFSDDDCTFAAAASALGAHLRQDFPKARIYLISLYQKGLFGRARLTQVLAANAALKVASGRFGITYVDIYDPIARACSGQESCNLLEPNRVHPSLLGYSLMSEVLERALRP